MVAEKNIYKRMQDITSELTAVAKNLNVGYGKNSYKAVGEADVLAAVKPLEAKHGIYSYPSFRRVIDSQIMTSTGYDGKEKQSQFVRVETEYTFVNVENPEEKLTITSYGDGVDPQDKAPGKAMTYADKYALLKAYKIITGDDPDQNESQQGRFEKKQQNPPTRKNPEPKKEETAPTGVTYATAEERHRLIEHCKTYKIDMGWLAETVGIKDKMTAPQFAKAMGIVNDIIAKKEIATE